MTPPTEADLLALAQRALEHAGEEAQVTAWWERRAWAEHGAAGAREWTSVEVLAVNDGRAGRAVTEAVDEDGLRWAAAAARRIAEEGGDEHAGLPDPAPGRPHDGWDPAVLTADPAEVAPGLAGRRRWAAAAARTAIVSTRGVRAFEQRTHARASAGGVELASVRAAAVPDPAPHGDRREEPRPTRVEPGQYAVVLGAAAVAAVLDPLRVLLALAAPPGRRVAAAAINLSESPRFAATLPRTYDAEGRPLAPAPLIQDGVATGNKAGDHLVLVGGGASGVEELAAPIDEGLYFPALRPLRGHTPLLAVGRPLRIRGGALEDGSVPGVRVEIEPLELLGAAQALTSWQATVPSADRSARRVGATVCPAGRFGGGVRVL